MTQMKSAKRTKKGRLAKATSKSRKKPVRIVGGTGRIPKDILDTPGPACPGAVEILIADRNR